MDRKWYANIEFEMQCTKDPININSYKLSQTVINNSIWKKNGKKKRRIRIQIIQTWNISSISFFSFRFTNSIFFETFIFTTASLMFFKWFLIAKPVIVFCYFFSFFFLLWETTCGMSEYVCVAYQLISTRILA